MIDWLFRAAYFSAYRMMRVYWRLRRPITHGALVAVWHKGRILLVRNSYVSYHTLPGGYLRRTESGVEAAQRELLEEVGLRVGRDELRLCLDVTHSWEGKQDHVQIFEVQAPDRPEVRVDHREVVAADFVSVAEALGRSLFPPLRDYLLQRESAQDRSTVPGSPTPSVP